MRNFVIAAIVLTAATSASAQVHVKGYVRSDGTYVAPYVRSSPDHSIYNNYSTQPNVNPYSGKVGTVNPYAPSNIYKAPSAPSPYGQPAQPCFYNCPG